ncbi:MAG: hypothetical protein ACRC33_03935 [Gemmataceae bacterium]
MSRLLTLLLIASAAVLAAPPEDTAWRPITTDPSPVGQLLRRWHAAGTAAGNAGVWYDNRDREHSTLDVRVWPQLRKVKYSEDEVKARRDWALATAVRPHVTFGNSSTSANVTGGGSNPRTAYTLPGGLAMLAKQYRGNNLYIYPEHRDHDPGRSGIGEIAKHSDHDPGRNGVGPGGEEGYGDLYPTNTPYLIISQGSSGSDHPFMRAIPFTLAAFRPEVKKLLVEKGLLMPTLQHILRATSKALRRPEDYATGLAHPSVFQGTNVDALAMAQMAHGMTAETVPPLAVLKVIEEESPVNGRDYFDLADRTEKLADTAHAVARVWRGVADTRRVVLSASGSEDVGGKELAFRWVVLRGDEKRITITPRGKGDVEAEVLLKHHPRRPVAPGSAVGSNRIDIGLFADNGKSVSAPAFFTYFLLDDEERTPGRVAYGAGTTEARVTDWLRVLAELSAAADLDAGPRDALARAVKKGRRLRDVVAEVRAIHQGAVKERDAVSARRVVAEKRAKDAPGDADAARAWADLKAEQVKADKVFRAADDRLKAAQKALDAELDASVEELGGSARAYAQARLKPTMPKEAVQFITRTNYVDPRLAAPKRWVDEYDKDGGWTRREGGKSARFTPEGWLVTREDDAGRPVRAVTVRYGQEVPKGGPPVSGSPLRYIKGDEEITIGYEGGKRVIKSRVKLRESAPF